MNDYWIPVIKGNYDIYEMSIVRQSNHHGQKSWGWFEEDRKICVVTTGGLGGRTPNDKNLIDMFLEITKRYCSYRNKKEFGRTIEYTETLEFKD